MIIIRFVQYVKLFGPRDVHKKSNLIYTNGGRSRVYKRGEYIVKKSTRYIILIVSNLIIFLLSIFTVNLDSWGALIPWCFVLAMVFLINPILSILFFRKDSNRLLRVLIELLISIILISIAACTKY